MSTPTGNWHGDTHYLGLHHDLHAGEKDAELGTRCGERELVPMLELMAPGLVQTDCKGHPGCTSWFSQVPNASVPPGLTQDALVQWRQATRKLGLPLHCHYSGIWDKAAGAKHPCRNDPGFGGVSAAADLPGAVTEYRRRRATPREDFSEEARPGDL